MTSLDAFVGLLQGAPFDLTADEIADALWLATMMVPLEAGEAPSSSEDDNTALPDETSTPEERPQEMPPGLPRMPLSSSEQERAAEVVLPSGCLTEASFPFRSPTAAAIPDPLALGRALRPLRRRVPSGTRFVLDESTTATFVADTFGLWLPVMKPAMSRWLDLELVVEDSPSMRLWSRALAELELLLQFNGAFRNVTRWRLGTDGPLGLFSGRDGSGAAPREHRELLDAQGRRAILIVSDCVSSAWYDGTLGEWLAGWTSCGPVAVLQVLPPHLWGRTALRRGLRATFSAANPAVSNKRLLTHYIVPPPRADQDLIPLPIVTLDPGSLGAWARLVAGLSGEGCGVALPAGGLVINGEEERLAAAPPPTAAARVRRFRATSAEAARRLASCLAVVPITLPIVRLIRASLVPEAGDSDIAEVFLGGLLREVSFDEDPDRTEYDFHDGVRALLLDYLPGRDTLQVIARVSNYIEPRLGETHDFLAGLTAVSEEDGSSFARRQRRFALLAVRALERLGDDYRENVAALHADIDSSGPDPSPATPGPGTRYLEHKAAEYEQTRQRLPAGPDRTSILDAVVEEVIRHVRSNAVGPDLIRTLYGTGRDGARVMALGCCVGTPDVTLVETVADALRSPRSRFELWWALQAARALIESVSPLHSERCVASVIDQIQLRRSLLNDQRDGNAGVLAVSVIDAFARAIRVRDRSFVLEWVEAGEGRQGTGRCAAILGSDPSGGNREFCRALGARLAIHGWNVVAGRGANVGPEVIDGFVAAGRSPEDAVLYSSGMFDSIDGMRRHMIARADGGFVIAGAAGTVAESGMARAERIPIVAIGFTGGVAARMAYTVTGEFSAQRISSDLWAFLETSRDITLLAEAAVRLLNLAVRRGVSEVPASLPSRREKAVPLHDELADARAHAIALGQIADVLTARGKLDEALRIRREEELPIYERLGDMRARVVTQGKIADLLIARGELDEALRIRREELPIYEELGDMRARAITLGQIADLLATRGELDEALRIRREEELPVYERLGDVRARAITLGEIADVLAARGELDEALRIRREEELPVYKRLGDVRARAITLGQIADVLVARGELDEALRIRREEELPSYERLGDVQARVITLGKIADVLAARGEFDEALRIRREEELPFYERLGDAEARAITLGQIADILADRGNLDEALRIRREEELPIYERLGDVQSRAITWGKIADVLAARGELEEALRIRREEELPVYEQIGDVRARAITLGQIADVLADRGELDEALRIRRDEELPVYERIGEVRERAIALGKIADVLVDRGELDEALRIRREEELPVYERLGDLRARAITLGQIADLLASRGERDRALVMWREALVARERLRASDLIAEARQSIVRLQKRRG